MQNNPSNIQLYSRIVDLLQSAKSKVVRTVNNTMVTTCFEIGRMIVEEEQDGKERADYRKQILKEFSKVLTKELGKGFSATNLRQMRQFYLVYSIGQTVSDDFKSISRTGSAKTITESIPQEFSLSWSHYLKLMRIDDKNERKYYEIEELKNSWSLRELQRQFNSELYTRLDIPIPLHHLFALVISNGEKALKLSIRPDRC